MRRSIAVLAVAGLAATFATAVRAESEGGDGGGGGVPGQSGGGATGGNAAAGGVLFAGACAVCHGADGGGGSGGPNVRGASAGAVLSAVRAGEDGMPRFPGIGRAAARNISAFLRGGAGTPAPTPAPAPSPGPSAPPTWKGQISAFFSQNCAACHKGAAAAMGVRLDSYATVSLNATRALSAIQAGRMPPGGSIAASQIQALNDWIAAGKPQ